MTELAPSGNINTVKHSKTLFYIINNNKDTWPPPRIKNNITFPFLFIYAQLLKESLVICTNFCSKNAE